MVLSWGDDSQDRLGTGLCALLSPTGQVDVLPAHSQPEDVFNQGPLHTSRLEDGWQVSWSSASYHLNEVNQFATSLVQQLVKGDACLMHPSCSAIDLHGLMQSKQLQLMQPTVPKQARGKGWLQDTHPDQRRLSSSSRIQALNSMHSHILSHRRGTSWIAATGSSSSSGGIGSGSLRGQALPGVRRGSSLFGAGRESSSAGGLPTSDPGTGLPSTRSTTTTTSSSSSSTGASRDQDGPRVQETQLLAKLLPPCDAAADRGAWNDLPAEVVCKVAKHLGSRVADVKGLYGTSRSWREAVLSDDHLLKGLHFSIDPARPFSGSCTNLRAQLGQKKRFPRLLERGQAVGNLSALTSTARLLDAGGRPEEGMGFWRKCAKAGALEGQLRLGLALYRGTCGVVQDGEEAHLYLNRAVKQVQSGPELKALPPREASVAAEVLRCGCLVLGYLFFDGEGVKGDRTEATRFFKLAATQGCKEAQQVLGWIFNTGQFG